VTDLTVPEVAAELRVSDETIRRWAKAGRFPGAFNLKGTSGWRIPRESLNRFRNGGRPRRTRPSGLSKRQQREQTN
jgi:excisionase family DNA binding protein